MAQLPTGRRLTKEEITLLVSPYDQAIQRCLEKLEPMEALSQANPGSLDNALVYNSLKAEYQFHRTARTDYVCGLYRMGLIGTKPGAPPEQLHRFHAYMQQRGGIWNTAPQDPPH